LPVHCDFVFIDAQKSQYGSYLEKIQEKLSSENTILLDDILKYQTKLEKLRNKEDKKLSEEDRTSEESTDSNSENKAKESKEEKLKNNNDEK